MKISLALSIAILLVGIVPGLFQRQHLTDLREEHRTLVAKAVKLGISVADDDETRQTKKQRVDTAKKVGAIADEMASFYLEMAALDAAGQGREQAVQDRKLEMKERLLAMDPAMLKQVIATLEGHPSIPDDARSGLIASTLLNLTEDRPETALALVIQAYGVLEKSPLGDQVVASALKRWATDSPESALSWLQANAEKYPGLASEEAKRALISGTASNDPAHAFKLMADLLPKDKSAAVRAIVAGCTAVPEKRDLFLSTLRGHLSAVADPAESRQLRDDAFQSLGRHLSKGNFEEGSEWVDKAGFSPEEMEKFATGLSYFSAKKDTGRWIDWLSANLPVEGAAGPVSTLVSEWTQKDHQAAGQWLVAAKDGPVKISAVRAYAAAVAEFEPTVATQWAMTLPAGPARDSTLRAIHQNWPASDPDGAAAFAREHGLK